MIQSKRIQLLRAAILCTCAIAVTLWSTEAVGAPTEDYCWPCDEFQMLCSGIQGFEDEFTPEAVAYCAANPTEVETFHAFHTESGPCTQGGGGHSLLHVGAGAWECRACGWESGCHEKYDLGPCHSHCQWGDPALVAQLVDAAQREDVAFIAQILRDTPELHHDAEGLSIGFRGVCAVPLGLLDGVAITTSLSRELVTAGFGSGSADGM